MTEQSLLNLDALTPITGLPSFDYLSHHAVLPLDVRDGVARVLTWNDRTEPQVLDDLRFALGGRIELLKAPPALVEEALAALQRLYGDAPATASALIERLDHSQEGGAAMLVDLDDVPLDDLVALANEPPVVRLVNMFLLEALDARASDVHIEHYAGGMRVRYRVDGTLRDVTAPPAHLAAAIVSRLKIMAHLDVAERRLPQDGRVRLRLKNRDVDVRVSTLPTLHGESLVLRLLDRDRARIALEELGMAPDTLAEFRKAIERPHGLVLVTGPTGSGKTTTLYAAIDHIRTGREKILTVEDPVEYELSGVPQVAVNERAGLTFARALRALLRQDPDVLMVGEIRDEETAEIATHAALTGHLVLSTLHTNSASGAVDRLRDLNVPSYLIAATLKGVLAQRLVPRLCGSCEGLGCAACYDEGRRGRTGAYELLEVDDDVAAAIHSGAISHELRDVAGYVGQRTIKEDLLRLADSRVIPPNAVDVQ